MSGEWAAVRHWPRRRWVVAVVGGLVTGLLVALPTAVIPNPVFGREIGVTWWSYPVVIVTAILGGLLIATYVRPRQPEPGSGDVAAPDELDRASKLGMAGALVTFFAVGCPVCNKLVLLALGTSGAITWFAPIQGYLALASVALMVVALRARLRGEIACSVPSRPPV
jgi:hypothetical protein